MQAAIDEIRPATWLGRARNWRWVGGDSSDPESRQHCFDPILEPARMARFADERAIEALAHPSEETLGHCLLAFQAGRQLDQHRAKPVTKRTHLGQELVKRFRHILQLALMRDRTWQLDREAKIFRHACRPAGRG